jgi:DNA polymerase III epsilon subunit-like protein
MVQGISPFRIDDTPIAIIDFETTGLIAGADRVVEVSVVRVDPGEEPRLVLDTLINPQRHVSATEIHGITDADVADAPYFQATLPPCDTISSLTVLAVTHIPSRQHSVSMAATVWWRELGMHMKLPSIPMSRNR